MVRLCLRPINFFLLAMVAGCLSPLDRFSDYNGGQLVISGQISPLAETNVVSIGRTSNRERLPEPVLGASVTLFDDKGNVFGYEEDPEVPGKYILPNVVGVPGNTYHIKVLLPGGQKYESIPEKMPLVTGHDEVHHTIEPEEYTDGDGVVAERYFVRIFVSDSLPSVSNPVYLKWHVEEVYVLSPTDFPDPFNSVPPSCYIHQQIDPQRIVLFNTEDVKAPFIPDLLVANRLVDPTFMERHYFTTFQSSLTRDAYEYWRKVNIVANQNGSIFDPPPARVMGNIVNVDDPDEEIHGYFQAVNQEFQRFFLLPDDLPYKMPIYCEYRADREYLSYPTECLNCRSVRNSSYNRPPWF